MNIPGAIIWVVCGVFLIMLAYIDIFLTVLHPTVESPLSNRCQQLIWQSLRACGNVPGMHRWRGALLRLGLPLMVAGLIMLWLLLIGFGFACIYYPWISHPSAFAASVPLRDDFFDALYYSGVTLATLGYGDIQPLTWPLRLLAVLEALTGAVTISAAVAYILAVYPALSEQRAVARALNAEVAGQSNALPLLRRYLRSDGRWHDDLFVQLRELALALMTISQNYELHPVLYYALPRHVQHSFVRVLITVQSIVAALRYGLSLEDNPDTVDHPHVLFLDQSLQYCLNQLAASIHIDVSAHMRARANRATLLHDYQQLCSELEQLDLVSSRAQDVAVPVLVKDDSEEDAHEQQPEQPELVGQTRTYSGEHDLLDPALDLDSVAPAEAYMVFRLRTDQLLAAYAAVCGYSLAEVRASSVTTWWTGEHEANAA